MRIALLTTHTLHHIFFAREISRIYGDVVVFCENESSVSIPYDTFHPFESEREKYELDYWFSGRDLKMKDVAPVADVKNMNDPQAIDLLLEAKADIFIVFGTGILKQPLIDVCRGRLVNLHGGDPENYRGLDTHLWAIFHKDFQALVTTLHHVDVGLDTGNVIAREPIPLHKGMNIYEVRAANTEVCVKLAATAFDMYLKNGKIESQPQLNKGRYYTAMPSVLKNLAKLNFEKYIKKIGNET